MRFLRFVLLCLLACPLVQGNPVFSQSPAGAPRILDRIDESRLIILKGNMHPAAVSENDRGPASPNLAMTDLVLVLRRGPDQQAAFDQCVASQYDPSSPNFHRWLEPADVGTMFGPALADIATISNWLAGQGLHVDQVSPDRMTIRFSGAAAQVESAFHVEIHNLIVNGQPHIANMSDPQIPAALAPVVAGVKALHNFFPRPLHQTGSLVRFDSAGAGWRRVSGAQQDATVSVSPHPYFGINVGSGTSAYTVEDVAPYDFATIYNVLPLWNSGTDGTGQTIAIAGTSDINTADVASFRSVFGLPAGTTPRTIVANGTDPGRCTSTSPGAACTIDDQVENTVDVEWSGAVAKGASIVLVVSGSNSATTDTVYSSANYVVQNVTANILSVSYGECELGEGVSGNAAYNNLWETAATEGIAVFVASGDAGAATCDQGANPPHPAVYGLSVSGVASTPYNTAVGGTDLSWGATASPYWAASNNSSNGSDALGYVPEVPWNDTCTNPLALNYLQEWAAALQKAGYGAITPTDAESACNFVNQWWSTIVGHTSPQVNLSPFLDTIGGGGGASNCTTGDGANVSSCAGGYAKPSWQSGVPGIPADGARDLPDVAFLAGNGFLGSAYLMCVSANGACVTSTTLTSNPTAQEVGGTSVGTPAMAGVMALINQKAGAPQGSPNAELYSMAAKQSYGNCNAETGTTNDGCSFNDIDTGTVAMACASGSPNCTVIHSSDTIGVLSGYGATPGFDLASGLGSLNVANVVNAWKPTIGTAAATVTVTPAQSSFPLNQSLNVTVTVNGASGTPTGMVSLTSGVYTGTAGTLSGGSYTFTIPGDALSTGADTLKVSYSGDATYARASGTASVTVAKLTPTVTEQPNLTNVGAGDNTVIMAVTVAGAGPTPTGTVTVSVPGYSAPTCTLSIDECLVSVPSSSLANGTDAITASYSGDSNYLAGTTSVTVNVEILTPTVTLTPLQTNPTTATTLQVTVNVSGSGPTPTGFVTLFGLYQYYPTGQQLSGGSYTFMVTPGDLAGGTDTMTVQYLGDDVYLPQKAMATVTVSKVTPTLTITPSATSMSSNLPLTITGTVTGGGTGPNGTVTVTANGQQFVGYLVNEAYSLQIPGGSLSVGTDTLAANYSGDSFNNPATNSTTVTVTQWVPAASAVTVTAAPSSIDTGQQLQVTMTVTGAYGSPTGTVTLSGGGFTGFASPLNNGSATNYLPMNSLSVGTDTLTASYSGDPTYLPSSGTSQVTVAQSVYTLSASTAASISSGGMSQSTVTVTSTTNYLGFVTLTCALTGQPAGAEFLPSCTTTNGVSMSAGDETGQSTINVSTTAATSALNRIMPQTKGRGWANSGGIVLALVILLGIPARRRRWRAMLGALVLLAAFVGISSCGGSNSGGCGSGGCGGGNSGTTPGTYTFTVTGVGNPTVTPAPTTTFTVIVD